MGLICRSDRTTPYQPEKDRNDGKNQQNVNKSFKAEHEESEQPADKQDNGYDV
jgi:hypothetical protein